MPNNNREGLGASDWLESYFGGNPVRLDPETKKTIESDRWDFEDFVAVRDEMRELPQAQRDLLGITDTGEEAIEDAYYTLKKPVPHHKDPKDIRPSYLINGRVMDDMMQLPEHERMRASSVADEVAAALAAVEIEPDLEVIFDKLKQEQQMANELEQMMMQAAELQEEIDDADEQMQKMQGQGQESQDGQPGKGQGNPQDQKEKAKEALRRLQEQMKEKAEQIDQGLEEKMPEMRNTMRDALQKANDQQDDMEQIQQSWGLDRGALNKLPAKRRIELAKRINTERFRRIAQVFGSVMRLAIAQQKKKTVYAKTEVCDIHFGNDISHVLPGEFADLLHPELRYEFFRKFLQRGLMQYKLEGEEKVAKGDIIYCDDGSGSMYGDPEIWAKAVGLALLNVARMQNRGFYGVHFGSPGEYAIFDFKGSKTTRTLDSGKVTEFGQIDGTIEYAELFFNSGTDFMTPLTVALQKLQEQHDEFGATKGDIVFATDGFCSVDDTWLKEFKEEQDRLKFKVYGVLIGGGDPDMEPLRTICDGNVIKVRSLVDGSEIEHILGGV